MKRSRSAFPARSAPMRVLSPAAPCVASCARSAPCAARCARPAPPRARRAPRRALRPPRAASDDEPDLITKLVGMIFGKQVLDDPEPAGLKRMNKTDWPDQYPAVVGEDAAPVEGDAPEAALLRPLLRQTQLEFQPLALAYDAEQHGWSEEAFHQRLDGMGAAVLVMQTAGGSICGGYNPKGWLGYGDWRDAISAFLFTWPGGKTAARALKLPKTGGSGMAIIDELNGGPQWGPEGLKISVSKRAARSRLGTYYERRPDGGRSLFTEAEGNTAEVVSLRAWIGVGVAPGTEGYKPSVLQWQPGELEKLREEDAKRGER